MTHTRTLIACAPIVLSAFAASFFGNDYWAGVALLVTMTAMVAIGIGSLAYYVGQVSVGHSALTAASGFVVVLLVRSYPDIPWPVVLTIGGLVGAMFSVVIAIPSWGVKLGGTTVHLSVASLLAAPIVIAVSDGALLTLVDPAYVLDDGQAWTPFENNQSLLLLAVPLLCLLGGTAYLLPLTRFGRWLTVPGAGTEGPSLLSGSTANKAKTVAIAIGYLIALAVVIRLINGLLWDTPAAVAFGLVLLVHLALIPAAVRRKATFGDRNVLVPKLLAFAVSGLFAGVAGAVVVFYYGLYSADVMALGITGALRAALVGLLLTHLLRVHVVAGCLLGSAVEIGAQLAVA